MAKVDDRACEKINGCEVKGEPWENAGALKDASFPSKNGTPLVTLVHPGGHQYLPETPKLIVKFFKEHSRPELPVE
jgi:polyhydroxybutyrate depolymerase